MSVREVLRRTAEAELAKGPRTAAEMVTAAMAAHPAEFEAEAQAAVVRSALATMRNLLAGFGAEGDHQLPLPGLNLPAAIAVRRGGGCVEYVAVEMATWSDLEGMLEESARKLIVAKAHRDARFEAMAVLRPLMADNPNMTLGDALRRLQRARAG